MAEIYINGVEEFEQNTKEGYAVVDFTADH